MMRRGIGRPGVGVRRVGAPLVRTVATTAVVAGTVGAVQHHQQQKYQAQANAQAEQQQQAQMAAEMEAMQQQQATLQAQLDAQQQAPSPPSAPAPLPAAGAPTEPAYLAELERLAQLQQQGIISEEEFQAKKKQILGL